MRGTHRWEEMLPEEFMEEFERAPIAYFACGAMEEHGLHNALGTDPFQGHELCLRAVEVTGGIVYPPVPFAPAYIPGLSREELRAGEKPLFPPSLWVSRELCERVYLELMESLADMGFRACLGVGGHYPADLLLRDLEQRHGGRIGDMRFYGGGTVRLLEEALAELSREDPLAGGHGTLWETSLVMAFRPEWVDLPRAQRIQESPLPSQLKACRPEHLAHIANANAALGERMLQIGAANLAAKARELLGEATG